MAKEYLEVIGSRVRKFRKEKGMTQEDLAERAGFQSSYIGKIERGTVNFTVDTLAKVAQGLKVNLFELLYEERDKLREQELRKEVIRLVAKQDLESLALLKGIMKRWAPQRK